MQYLILIPAIAALTPTSAPEQIEIVVHMAGLSSEVEVPESMDDPIGWIRDSTKAGNIRWSRRFQLMTLDQLPATVQHGEQQPVVVGYSVRGFSGGRSSSSPQRGAAGAPSRIPTTQMQSTGAVLTVVPQLTEDGSILIEIDLEDARLVPKEPTEGDEVNVGMTTVTVQLSTTVSVTPEGPAVLKLQQSGQASQQLNGSVLTVIEARVVN